MWKRERFQIAVKYLSVTELWFKVTGLIAFSFDTGRVPLLNLRLDWYHIDKKKAKRTEENHN